MKKFCLFLFSLLLSLGSYAQDSSAEQMFKTGESLYKDKKFVEALPYIKDAANSGHAEAQFLLARMYYLGDGVSSDYSQAMKWFQKSSEQGFNKAFANIGLMYLLGDGVNKDYSIAMKNFMKAAEQNVASAQHFVGYMYYNGLGVSKDYNKAIEWFLKSANQGFEMAQDYLGNMYEFGYGVSINYSEAAKWYQKAADQGNNHSLFNLGVFYERGKGVKQDYKKAIKLYTKAAENNYALAQDNLGYMYENGFGVTKSSSTAAKWYRKASDQGLPNALNNLGRLYFTGKGVKKDYAEAAWLIQQAAEKGNERAMSNLGVLYENGYGVYKDLRLAATWYQKTVIANPSDIEARNGLARLQAYAPQIQEKQVPNQPTVQEPKEDSPIDASGTGFLIDKRGYLATNNHVTKGAKGISVCLQIDGEWKAYNAVLVKNDPTNDLSIIRIEDSEFKPFTSLPYNFTTEVEEVASDIYTLGYPQVHIMGTEVKYTTGAINSKSGVQGDPTHYQISAHIDHGNSGGPMFNSKGTIIGITDSGLDKAEFGDVNYAIKSSYLKSLVDALPVKLELPHDTSIEKLSRVEQIKVLSKFTALILINLP
jgi:TPR repeat protein